MSKKKKLVIVLGLILVLGLGFLFIKSFENHKRSVCYKDACFYVEVADSGTERERGLSGRRELAQDKGMLFVFNSPGKYSFWMKDTFVPLDIIWIDENDKVVYIKEDTRPCEETCEPIVPEGEAKYVLEINAGKVREMGLKVGESLKK